MVKLGSNRPEPGKEGLEHGVGMQPWFVQELGGFSGETSSGSVTDHPLRKTNNPTVFYLYCKSKGILDFCFSADSRKGHSVSHT